MQYLSIIIAAMVGGVAALFVAGIIHKKWPRQGKWGMNPNPVCCPECGVPAPRIRIPTSRRQMLWGGWTCSSCVLRIKRHIA